MVNEAALSGLSADDQAYVMGHAIGVYLMGKTLPARVADKGYLYRPGKSSQHAFQAYVWEDLLKIRSGGSDGSGGVIYDDVGQPTPWAGDSYDTDPGDPNHDEPGEPSDDVEVGDGGDNDNENPNGDPDDPDGHGECGVITAECAAFINPSAFDAKGLAGQVDPARFAADGVTGPALDRFVDVFRRGLTEALSVEDIDALIDSSEVVDTEDDVLDQGYCEY